jgi:superfamily II DNA/RNA helicase
MREFTFGTNPIMVVTDIAARGFHIKDIKLIINYDLPTEIEFYVNRIGRTGRIESKVLPFLFFHQMT